MSDILYSLFVSNAVLRYHKQRLRIWAVCCIILANGFCFISTKNILVFYFRAVLLRRAVLSVCFECSLALPQAKTQNLGLLCGGDRRCLAAMMHIYTTAS